MLGEQGYLYPAFFVLRKITAVSNQNVQISPGIFTISLYIMI